jgi:hypothetical protein
LQASVRFAPGKARVIADAHERNPLAQLLRAANETMLGRSLRFDSAAGGSLTLDVAGRRVLRVSGATGLPGAEICLGIETLEDEHKDDLIKLLQALAVAQNELRVVSGPIGRGGEEVSVGLPVALLADLLLIELNVVGSSEPEPDVAVPTAAAAPQETQSPGIALTGDFLSRFSQGLSELLLASILSGGDDEITHGPEEMVTHLQGFLADEKQALERQLDTVAGGTSGPVCIFLGATLDEGHSVLCARHEQSLLLGLIEGDATRAVLPAWNAALR